MANFYRKWPLPFYAPEFFLQKPGEKMANFYLKRFKPFSAQEFCLQKRGRKWQFF